MKTRESARQFIRYNCTEELRNNDLHLQGK